jgi:hypothetical protein
MLLEAETNKYCPGRYDFGAISNLITWVLNFFLSVALKTEDEKMKSWELYVQYNVHVQYVHYCIEFLS